MWENNKKTQVKKPISGMLKSVPISGMLKAVVWGGEKKTRAKRAISGRKKEVWEEFEKGYRPAELYGKYPDLQKRTLIIYFSQWNKLKWGKTDDS